MGIHEKLMKIQSELKAPKGQYNSFGKYNYRKTDKYIYEDEQAIKDYCNVNQLDCIRVKEELDKTAFKKICKDGINQETGELVPGVRVEKVESISVKVE